ncbi:MAG: UDP-N-acetylglucosamine--N-acetylmuramyl-(pentapeptide) pyrophosphoryl-undecaprenol N-acetylglucosamine transferase [Candidatus Colwellbacteria bacterium]|nr:UDP-N-acetylglucosamine--N-acetylmuramyl-(pentapeptide) pyrophosphoryl-undecaprenol N-acetylglucosamine transferase [Candidatus Colwellbacteria bacterium]
MKRVLLVGGGTGGHVYPLIAVADEIKTQAQQQGLDLELLLLGEGSFFERAVREKGYNFKKIWSGKLRRYASPLTVLDIIKLPVGFLQSLWHIFWFMPDMVFTKGGAVSFPPSLVAWLYLIPIYIHESDSMPGLANTMISKLAKKVFISFESASRFFNSSKVEYAGNPLRKELLGGDRLKATTAFNLNQERKTILVLGGSQGAKKVNDAVLDTLVLLIGQFQIIHQCGEGQYNAVKASVEKIVKEGEKSYGVSITENYHLYPFFGTEQMALAYAASDVIMSRAGAGLVFEIAALGKPVILIPLVNGSRGEQKTNAFELAKYGAVVIEEENLTRNIILDQIKHLLENSASISEKLRGFIKADAAAAIASSILSNVQV